MSLSGTLRSLPPESRMTGGAAAALIVSMFLPWYQVSFFRGSDAVTDSRSALQVFTWVEAAILLVALAVLFLVWARAQRQAFHLPGGDGFVVSVAGALGARADRLAAVRQAERRRAGRDGRHPVGHLLRAARRRRARGRRRARARRGPARAAQPDRAEEPEWEVPARARAPRARRQTAGRASTPRSRRCCASARPRWDGEPPEAPGRARRTARTARRTPPDDAFLSNRRASRAGPTACS